MRRLDVGGRRDGPPRSRRNGRHRDGVAAGRHRDRRRADRGHRSRTCRAWQRPPKETIDATGLLVLPGAVDVHTHTRVATDAEPDRFFQDSVAAAFGGTTTFLAFNNPGTGSSAGRRAVASSPACANGERPPTSDSAIDYGLSLAISGRMDDPDRRAAGGHRRRRRHVQGVHGLRLPARRSAPVRGDAGDGRARRHAPGPLRGPGPARRGRRPTPCDRGDVLPRYHATTRPSYVEAVATARALAFARMAEAPVHVVHLSSAAALDEVRRGPGGRRRASRPRRARTTSS